MPRRWVQLGKRFPVHGRKQRATDKRGYVDKARTEFTLTSR